MVPIPLDLVFDAFANYCAVLRKNGQEDKGRDLHNFCELTGVDLEMPIYGSENTLHVLNLLVKQDYTYTIIKVMEAKMQRSKNK